MVRRGVSREPRGAQATGGGSARDTGQESLCTRQRAHGLPGLHMLWDQDLMSANPGVPYPELAGPLALDTVRSGGPVSPGKRAVGLGRSPDTVLAALRFALADGEGVSVKRTVVLVGVPIALPDFEVERERTP